MKITQKKIFLLGYYGFGNWGDELTLQSVINDFEKISKSTSCSFYYSVLTQNKIFFPLPLPNLFMIFRKKPISVLREIAKTNYIVVGGGSLLQDSTSFRSLLYYFFLLCWALFFRRPIIFYRCGLGPLRTALSQKMVSYVLKRSKLFIARDQESADFVNNLSGGRIPVKIGIDPVVSAFNGFVNVSKATSTVSFFVRSCKLPYEEKLIENLKYLKGKIQERIEIVAFHYECDHEIASRIADQIGCQWKYFRSLEEIKSYFYQLSAIFTMRLHPAILSAMMEVPWFALNIDPKIESFANWWEKKNLVNWKDISRETFLTFYKNREDIFKCNNEVKSRLRQLDDQSRIWLQEQLFKDGVFAAKGN